MEKPNFDGFSYRMHEPENGSIVRESDLKRGDSNSSDPTKFQLKSSVESDNLLSKVRSQDSQVT